MDEPNTSHRRAVIGNPSASFWRYDSRTGFDLTHPPTPMSPTPVPHYTMSTTTQPITIAPSITALVIIDMQNFFLSPSLGRSRDAQGLQAQRQLLARAIPAARKAGIRIIWLNWGLLDADLVAMPPATLRAFGFETVAVVPEVGPSATTKPLPAAATSDKAAGSEVRGTATVETSGKSARLYKGLGADMGRVTLDDGTVVEGGRLLMRDSWNADLTPELRAAYEAGLGASPPDVWIHKTRMSGLWGARTDCTAFLEREGITTLFFAGVNTDQCVGGSLQDAFSQGYDVVLLSDAARTTSPSSCQESIEFNCAKSWGFCTTCEQFAQGLGLST